MSAQHDLPTPPSDAISALRFSPSGTKLAVASWDSSISIYTHDPSLQAADDAPFTRESVVPTRAAVLDVAWGLDDSTLFFVGLDHDVRVMTEGGGQEVLSTHEQPSNKVLYSKAQNVVISTGWEGCMHVQEPQSKQHVRIQLAAKPFAVGLTDTRLVVAMASRKVSVYDLHALRMLLDQAGGSADREEALEVAPWQARESSLKFMTRAVSCMPDGTGFATSSIEGRVAVEWFDPEEQKKTYAFKCHRQTNTVEEAGEEKKVDIIYPVNALAFHHVHGTFATGGGDGVVAIWDAQTKRRIKQYGKFGTSVAALDFSNDGKFLAVGVSPGFEDGQEDTDPDPSLVKVVIRTMADDEAKGKPAK